MTPTATLAQSTDVVAFWFAPDARPLWFAATPAFDDALRARFLTTYRAAAAGRLTDWEATPAGALALVIVLDQFPLKRFRGQSESFATEAAARTVADRAITRGFDRTLPPVQRQFLYLPFMHGEALADQERSVRLYQQPDCAARIVPVPGLTTGFPESEAVLPNSYSGWLPAQRARAAVAFGAC